MFKKSALLVMLVASLCIFATYASADTSEDIERLSGTGSVTGVNESSATVHDYTTHADVGSFSFDTVDVFTAWGEAPDEYIKVVVNDNSINWRLRIYTDNFRNTADDPGTDFDVTPDSNTWGFAYGGMIQSTSTVGAKAGLAWQASSETVKPANGDPGASPSVGWTYIKDIKDVDDPFTNLYTDTTDPGVQTSTYTYGTFTLLTSTSPTESFANKYVTHDVYDVELDAVVSGGYDLSGADKAGYCNTAYGSVSYTSLAHPTKQIQLDNRTDPFYIHLEGDFLPAPAGSYYTYLKLELMHL